MDPHIGQGVEPQQDGGVFLHQGGQVMVHRRVIITHHLSIRGPALSITAKIQKVADGVRILPGEIGGLVEVAGVSFMGQGGEEGNVVAKMAGIDVDHIFPGIVDGRDQVEGGA